MIYLLFQLCLSLLAVAFLVGDRFVRGQAQAMAMVSATLSRRLSWQAVANKRSAPVCDEYNLAVHKLILVHELPADRSSPHCASVDYDVAGSASPHMPSFK